MIKILFHACCGPCSSAVYEGILADQDVTPSFFFFNPYIQPYLEFEKRLQSFEVFMHEFSLPYEVDRTYDLDSLSQYTRLSSPRCHHCYERRLDRTAQKAREAGFDGFSTTLLVSPYQDHDQLITRGTALGSRYGIEFYYRDYRPCFPAHRDYTAQYHLYRQQYCGCIYSEYDRYSSEKNRTGRIKALESR